MTNRIHSRLFSPAFWRSFLGYVGIGQGARRQRIADGEALEEFIRTRAAHVAQTALYGYLRTRAGARFPELFSDDRFVESINIAKWHIWLACVSDLAVYSGGMVRRTSRAGPAKVAQLMRAIVERVLDATGTPADAGPGFGAHAERVRARIALCDWGRLADEEGPFSESPDALVTWAPIADELKQLDEGIVRNSMRFRWQEVRRDLRRLLDVEALVAAMNAGDHGESLRAG